MAQSRYWIARMGRRTRGMFAGSHWHARELAARHFKVAPHDPRLLVWCAS